ncbi:FAD-binding oxidoreductase [Parvibaculum sp. MBR-TMA-1.3b-4.2]|jgi:FAD/FMN-containing dehydrogenase
MSDDFQSWGRFPAAPHQKAVAWRDRRRMPMLGDGPVLARGNGRSYGDVCLNDGGTLLTTRPLDKFVLFDEEAGELVCEPGVLLSDILDLIVPKGWFLPVVPGTRLVTVGGAIANDVHGKNHHRFGTFGTNVLDFRLLRSDGTALSCSRNENAELFAATIGGLGLTGLIAEVRLKLRPIASSYLEGEQFRFDTLDEFFALSKGSEASHEYTAAWIDCLAEGDRLGRGHFMRANHAADGGLDPAARSLPLAVPLTPPLSLVNRVSLRVFNTLYYERQRAHEVSRRWHFDPYLFPLDSIANWNWLYGPKGFLQYQCVVPDNEARAASAELLKEISRSGQGSPLVVFKTFGDVASPGLLSFPMKGATLALDFPILGKRTFELLDRLDGIVVEAGGRLYPAKDARMSVEMFEKGFPALDRFMKQIDPAFGSGFERRVMGRA